MKATEIGSQTMVGYGDPFPQKKGNCFSILAEDGNYYRIVNFGVENLQELIRRKTLEPPVNIEPMSKRSNGQILAIIQDDRIPPEWYRENYCATCCPEEWRGATIGTGEMLPPSPVPRADKSLSDYRGQLETKRKRRKE